MNLDGQWFLREEQLEEQSRIGRMHVRALKPEFSDGGAIVTCLAPGPEIGASPGFAHDLHAGMFDRHDLLLVCIAPIGPMAAPIRTSSPTAPRLGRRILRRLMEKTLWHRAAEAHASAMPTFFASPHSVWFLTAVHKSRALDQSHL